MKYVNIWIFLIGFAVTMTAQSPRIEYSLGMPQPWTHLFEVQITVEQISDSTLDFMMPVWRSGRYSVFDFAGGVSSFNAHDKTGKSLPWEKIDKSTWRVQIKSASGIVVRYQVYANEFGSRTRGLNDEHGFLDGAAVFMYMEQYRSVPVELQVFPYLDWNVTTGLTPHDSSRFRYIVPSYDYLVDCPLEIGHHKDYTFEVEGVSHTLTVAGDMQWDPDTAIEGLRRIIAMNKKFWGDLPYDRFIFMVHAYPNASGATEHINSTIIGTRPNGYSTFDSYSGFFRTASHEFFHVWNVKRLRPKGMEEYEWSRENYFRELWIAEGGTSYYNGLLMERAGMIGPIEYLSQIAGSVRNDRRRPGNSVQSLTECSFDAWIKFSRSTEQAYNFETSFYDKGAHVFLVLDLAIRQRSGNKRSLDDVMKTMYERFPLGGPGYSVEDFQRTCEEEAGKPLDDLFQQFVYGVSPLPWEEILAQAGLRLTTVDPETTSSIGIETEERNGVTRITRVTAGTSGYDAGLNIGDEIVALNGRKVRSSELAKEVEQMNAGDTARLSVFRNDRLREFLVPVRSIPTHSYHIDKMSMPTDLQKTIYESWLSTSWEDKKKK